MKAMWLILNLAANILNDKNYVCITVYHFENESKFNEVQIVVMAYSADLVTQIFME